MGNWMMHSGIAHIIAGQGISVDPLSLGPSSTLWEYLPHLLFSMAQWNWTPEIVPLFGKAPAIYVS